MSFGFIFDMDGVIIDSEPLHFRVDQDVMTHFGVTITPEELEEYVGMTNPDMWSGLRVKYSLKESVTEIIDVQLKMKIASLLETDEKPIPGIVQLLEELRRRNMKIGLASSSPRLFIETVLDQFGITHYFDCIVSGEEVEKGKPDPAVYLEAARQLQVNPASCWAIEDSKNGVAAAKAAGMKCIGFINYNSGNQDLSSADMLVDSIKKINLDDLYTG